MLNSFDLFILKIVVYVTNIAVSAIEAFFIIVLIKMVIAGLKE